MVLEEAEDEDSPKEEMEVGAKAEDGASPERRRTAPTVLDGMCMLRLRFVLWIGSESVSCSFVSKATGWFEQ